jgi:hypothetical protein
MRQRTRKLIGVIVMPLYLAIYVLIMMAIGAALAGRDVGEGVRFAYHAIAGFAWLPGAMLIIRWMARPDPGDDRRQQG